MVPGRARVRAFRDRLLSLVGYTRSRIEELDPSVGPARQTELRPRKVAA